MDSGVQLNSPRNFYYPIISQIGQYVVLLHYTLYVFNLKYEGHLANIQNNYFLPVVKAIFKVSSFPLRELK